MEAILRFMPHEEQVSYSAMTGQSLFYMGGMNLKNKVLAIAEEGIRQASYALKLLQSEGQLTIASTGMLANHQPTHSQSSMQANGWRLSFLLDTRFRKQAVACRLAP